MERRIAMLLIWLFALMGTAKAQVNIVVKPNPIAPESSLVQFGFANGLDQAIEVWQIPPETFAIKDSVGHDVFVPDFFAPQVITIEAGDTGFVANWDLLDNDGTKVKRGSYQVEMNYYLDQASHLLSSPFRVDWVDTLMYYDPDLKPSEYVILPNFPKRAVKYSKFDFDIPADSTITFHRIIIDAHNSVPVQFGFFRTDTVTGLPGESLFPLVQTTLDYGWNEIADSTGWVIADSTFWLVLFGNYDFLLTGYSYPGPAEHSWIYLAGIWGTAPFEIGMGLIRSNRNPSGIKETPDSPLPKGFQLVQNYPNPFNPQTTISFEIPQKQWVSLDIYSLRGTFIRRLVEGERDAGQHQVLWDGRSDEGFSVPSGIYFYRLKVGVFELTRKLVLCK